MIYFLGENVVLLTKSDNDHVHVYFVKVLQFFILHQLVQRKGTQSVLQFVVSKSCMAWLFSSKALGSSTFRDVCLVLFECRELGLATYHGLKYHMGNIKHPKPPIIPDKKMWQSMPVLSLVESRNFLSAFVYIKK